MLFRSCDSETHRVQRIEFAREHETWTDDQWQRVLFGDESYIYLGSNNQVWCQRPEDAAYVSRYMREGISGFSPRVAVFACFSADGPGGFRILYDNIEERLYTDTMSKFMKPIGLRVFPSGPWWYLHDNAGYHTSRMSTTWFHNNGVDCIKIPPCSPDLNPIENLFSYWKKRVDDRHPRTITQLRKICSEE